jgi:hypothetical protein
MMMETRWKKHLTKDGRNIRDGTPYEVLMHTHQYPAVRGNTRHARGVPNGNTGGAVDPGSRSEFIGEATESAVFSGERAPDQYLSESITLRRIRLAA